MLTAMVWVGWSLADLLLSSVPPPRRASGGPVDPRVVRWRNTAMTAATFALAVLATAWLNGGA